MASTDTPIAIVGMACRFSGAANNPEKLWDLLSDGRSGWSEIPEERFATKGLLHPDGQKIGSTHVRGGHFLAQDPALFDAPFFNLSAEVASTMDPQHRLTLEVVYEAMENAGITMSDFEGSDTSVFAGCMLRDYHDTLSRDPDTLPRFFMTSNAATMASNRVSHFYDLHGPSMTVDTGCSTTLTAVHLACQNLRARESSASVVTGASLMLNPDYFVSMSSIGFLSPDGISYAFDNRANGYGRGEGVAAIILKRLDDAVAAGDSIRAVIRSTALNQDGKTPTITTPCQEAQADLIRSCYMQANLDPAETGYVEAHGTGTPVGDPIELGAIAKALRGTAGQADTPLLVGSVKTAIGHTEAASGLASIIKVVMGLEKGLVSPNCTFKRKNENIDLEGLNIRIPTVVEPWPLTGTVRQASINNFGFGGANAHAIIEEYRGPPRGPPQMDPSQHQSFNGTMNGTTNGHINDYVNDVDRTHAVRVNGTLNGESNGTGAIVQPLKATTKANGIHWTKQPTSDGVRNNNRSKSETCETKTVHHSDPFGSPVKSPSCSANGTVDGTTNGTPLARIVNKIFVLSAKDEAACKKIAADLANYFVSAKVNDPDRTLDDLAYTLAERRSRFPWMTVISASSLESLTSSLESKTITPVCTSIKPRVGLIFNGQGAQWYAMGRELLHTYPVFRASIEAMNGYIKEVGAEWSFTEELSRDEETTNVHKLEYSLPMCSAIQIAIVDLLRSWGIRPHSVTGHSSGEVAAAYAANALDARSAIAIPYLRGALSAKTEGIIGNGAMMAIGLSRERAEEYIALVTTGSVVLACVNSQNSVTASGDLSAITELEQLLVNDKIFCRRLRINGAFHSNHMSPISEMYMAELRSFLRPPPALEMQSVVFSSSMTGGRLTDLKRLATPEYWNANMLGVVEFEASFRNMCFLDPSSAKESGRSREIDLVVEVGPHGSLASPIQDLMTLPEFNDSNISYLNCLVRKKNAVETMRTLACELLRKGQPIDLRAVNFPNGVRNARLIHDLPSYPWSHTRFWLESRVNLAWRERNTPSHDILGTYQSSANSYTPTWRNIVRTSNLPWLRDHVLGTNIVYPGAAYICMAVEAASMLARLKGNTGDVLGYNLQDIQFVNALIIPDADGREVQLTISPCDERSLGIRGWQDFRVFSVSGDNRWSEHCCGLIQVELATRYTHSTIGSSEFRLSERDPKPATYTRKVDPADMWAAMHRVGIHHGPVFKNMIRVVSNRDESVATFSIADTSQVMPMRHESEYVIHPTTLDSVFQAAYSTLPGLGTTLKSPFVPRSIKQLRLRQHIVNSPGHEFQTHVHSGAKKPNSFHVDLTVFDADDSLSKAVLEVRGLACRRLDGAASRTEGQGTSLLCKTQWAPDLSFQAPGHAFEHLKYPVRADEVATMMQLRQAVLFYIQYAVAALSETDIQNLEWHHAKPYQWMKDQLSLAADDKLGPSSSTWLAIPAAERSLLLNNAAATSVNGEMLQRVGPRIPEILKLEVTALELMLEDGLLFRYYRDALKWDRSTHQVAQLVRMLAHKNPRSKILEIGAGTGGGTQAILEALGRQDSEGGVIFSQYDFTDISPGFFEAARKRFEPWKDVMTFQKLDIEADTDMQGFESGSYDVIVACQVLHATRSIENTMRNVRRLLKPNGKLVLIETTQDSMDVFLAFGLLPGWWLSEEVERKTSPSLTVPFWDQVLRTTGFTGLDQELRDCEDEQFYNFSVILSTAEPGLTVCNPDVVLVCDPASSPPLGWLYRVQTDIATILGETPSIETLDSFPVLHGKTCIYLGDLKRAILADMTESKFAAIKAMVTSCDGLFWVTRGGAMESTNPEASLSHGLLRTLRREYHGKKYVTFDVDAGRPAWTSKTATAISEVFAAAFGDSKNSSPQDLEYAERRGVIHVPRVFMDKTLMDAVGNGESIAAETTMKNFADQNNPVRLHIESQGLLNTLTFVEDHSRAAELPSEYIDINPKAFGLNFRDIMVAMGQIGINNLHASECSGIITRLGSDAANQGFKVGDRVCALLLDHWTTRPRAHWSSVAKIPDDMTFEFAAAVPVTFATAYISLHEVARLQKGEAVLIHSAAGGLGQAAIQLCQHIGAEIYATVGSKRKKDFLVEKFGIPDSRIFSSRDSSLHVDVMQRTDGNGVDVVLNSLAGSLLQQSFDCLADFGRFVELGKRDFEQNNRLDMATFRRNTTFHSVDLLAWEDRKRYVVSRVLKEVVRLLDKKVVAAPDPITTFPIPNIEQSFRFMQTGQHIGKIVVTVDDTDLVPVKRGPRRQTLRTDASYLVVGGMGGIGRSLCEWMVERGAKHLIILSRNAQVDDFISTLSCNVRVVQCDVSDKIHLASAIASCTDMPPIRGVLQAAMVLQDSVFEQMTCSQFNLTISPKVRGSHNLHNHLSTLDFFIMLSSVLGVLGSPSQGNYTAAGAYQDALAHSRRTTGLPATSIDLGMVQAVGYVAGKSAVSSRLSKNGIGTLQEETVLRILEAAVFDHQGSEQIITGLKTDVDDLDWMRQDGRFAALRYREGRSLHATKVADRENATKLRSVLRDEMGIEEASVAVMGELSRKIMDMFGTKEVDPSKDLAAHGVDSLVAVELRNWVATQAGVELAILDLMQSQSLTELAEMMASRLGYIRK